MCIFFRYLQSEREIKGQIGNMKRSRDTKGRNESFAAVRRNDGETEYACLINLN